jgi:type IV secretory pathway TrbL component
MEQDQSREILQPTQVVSDVKLRETITYTLLWFFGLSTLATFILMFCWGLGYLNRFPESFVRWLMGATIGELATFMGLIIKSFFPQPTGKKGKKQVDKVV